MNPFDERFLADIKLIQIQLAKQAQIFQNQIPAEQIESMIRMQESVQKSVAPLQEMIKSPSFQAQLRTIQDTASKLSKTLPFKPYVTVADFNDLNQLYMEVEIVSQAVQTPVPLTKAQRDVQIVRPLYSQTKTEIKKGRFILPLSLPKEVSWEQVRVTFVDRDTAILEFLSIGQKIVADYTDMGMWDGRTKQSNAQWYLFRMLAKNEGRMTWKSSDANDTVKKQKQLLSEALSNFFNIPGDPFLVYRQAKAYELRMMLVSPPETLEIVNYYDELTPSAYQEEGKFND